MNTAVTPSPPLSGRTQVAPSFGGKKRKKRISIVLCGSARVGTRERERERERERVVPDDDDEDVDTSAKRAVG